MGNGGLSVYLLCESCPMLDACPGQFPGLVPACCQHLQLRDTCGPGFSRKVFYLSFVSGLGGNVAISLQR